MKVSVITFQNVLNNYGSVLQAFATQEKLKEYAHEVELIDYWKKHMTIKGVLSKRNIVKIAGKMLSIIKWRVMFKIFSKQYLNITPGTYKSEDDFQSFPIHDGIYCTGSDQLWNPMWGDDLDPLFMSFVPEEKRRFAYATSFGIERLSDDSVSKYKKHIERYERISVREYTGLKILHEQFGYNDAVQLVDPTLAMPPEFWRRFEPKPRIKGEYILIYCIHKSKSFIKYAKKLSEKTKLPVVCLCQYYHVLMLGCRNVLIPSIFEFISLIDNAGYVLSDSFHAIAFCMLMNTEPVYISAETAHAGRISSFLHLIGAEHRQVRSIDDFDVINRPVDWDSVNSVLARERERVDEFLRGVFQVSM